MTNKVHLITYVERLAPSGILELASLLSPPNGPLANIFAGVHLLPFFHPIDGADAGFDPIDHTQVDSRLGTWQDLGALCQTAEVMADLIVNHVSSSSPQFLDFSRNGDSSLYASLFLSYSRVFPNGASERDLVTLYRPRPGLPFTKTTLQNGEQRMLWTTFTPQQIDIDVTSPQGSAYLDSILNQFQTAGIRVIRLDAAGYAIKKPGTSCFMIPETYAFIADLTARAHARDIEVLVEIHSYYKEQVEIAKHVDYVYDFALPPLVLHALFAADADPLKQWLAIAPRNAITVLDTHDGIGVIDVGAHAADPAGKPGLLKPDSIHNLVESIHARCDNQSRQATGAAASNLDLYQVNSSYYSALGCRDTEYLIARAIQFFAPGVPQVYYTGLLAGANDMALLHRTRNGRDINRHYYTAQEIQDELTRPVVQKLIELIRFRNAHPAFQGEFELNGDTPPNVLDVTWRNGSNFARLHADLAVPSASITCSTPTGEQILEVAA